MTTKIDIFSGFLGAGKTTLIKKLIEEAYQGERLVLIENEFGDIAIDGGFLQDAGRPGFNPWVGTIPWRRERLPTPVFWPENSMDCLVMGSQRVEHD